MPRDKDLKRLVRTRMKKTGESYTTARAHVASKPTRKAAAASPRDEAVSVVADASVDFGDTGGMSDETTREKTGHTWKEWVRIIDEAGGRAMSHGERATLINKVHGVDGWWSQWVTTGYERITGLRAPGQRMDGSWEANKSKTFAVPVDELFEAWSDTKFRRRWLKDSSLKVRTATAPKSMRLQFGDGTIVAVGFTPKGEEKSSAAIQHTKLPDKESAERMKRYWKEKLEALAELLEA